MKVLAFCRILVIFFLLWGCGPGPATEALAELPQGCAASGPIVSADLPGPARGYAYSYRVYLPPCTSSDGGSHYPVLYLVPGRNGAPDSWFAAGLAEVVDGMILAGEIPPFLIVTTENIGADPLADTIYRELIPHIEEQYPVLDDRRYRAVAGGSLGGIAAYRLAFQYPDSFSSAGIFGAGAISGEEAQIHAWLSAMEEENHVRVFMDTGDEDIFMLDRAVVMKSILDEYGLETRLHSGRGGHNYAYWVGNFKMYLEWLARDW
jgi:enterochelin esterase-like enzyme